MGQYSNQLATWPGQEVVLLTCSVVHSFIHQQWTECFPGLSSGSSSESSRSNHSVAVPSWTSCIVLARSQLFSSLGWDYSGYVTRGIFSGVKDPTLSGVLSGCWGLYRVGTENTDFGTSRSSAELLAVLQTSCVICCTS